MCVKTNVDYQVVATFVSESESTENIEEALNIIKEWNPEFQPRYFMTDYSNEEMSAIGTVFPAKEIVVPVILYTVYFLCFFMYRQK